MDAKRLWMPKGHKMAYLKIRFCGKVAESCEKGPSENMKSNPLNIAQSLKSRLLYRMLIQTTTIRTYIRFMLQYFLKKVLTPVVPREILTGAPSVEVQVVMQQVLSQHIV